MSFTKEIFVSGILYIVIIEFYLFIGGKLWIDINQLRKQVFWE